MVQIIRNKDFWCSANRVFRIENNSSFHSIYDVLFLKIFLFAEVSSSSFSENIFPINHNKNHIIKKDISYFEINSRRIFCVAFANKTKMKLLLLFSTTKPYDE